jgi:hypothetical protein
MIDVIDRDKAFTMGARHFGIDMSDDFVCNVTGSPACFN